MRFLLLAVVWPGKLPCRRGVAEMHAHTFYDPSHIASSAAPSGLVVPSDVSSRTGIWLAVAGRDAYLDSASTGVPKDRARASTAKRRIVSSSRAGRIAGS